VKKRSLITTLLLLILWGVSYVQNGWLDQIAWWYGNIPEDTLDWDNFEIIPWLERNKFTHGVHKVESKNENYQAFNPITSALWRYQFVPKYFRDDIQKITKATSHQEFLDNPAMQEQFMDWHIDKTLIPWYEKILSAWIVNDYTDAEVLALIHFLWVTGATQYIETNEMMEKQKVWNVDASRYLEIVNKAMAAYN